MGWRSDEWRIRGLDPYRVSHCASTSRNIKLRPNLNARFMKVAQPFGLAITAMLTLLSRALLGQQLDITMDMETDMPSRTP